MRRGRRGGRRWTVAVASRVVVTNNDATMHRAWLKGFLEGFGRDEKIGAVQSKIFFADRQLINSAGDFAAVAAGGTISVTGSAVFVSDFAVTGADAPSTPPGA